MRKMYFHRHPRNFGNECDLVATTTAAQSQRLHDLGYVRISLHNLRPHLRWMNAENDAWGSGRAFGRYSVETIASYSEWLEE